MGYVQPLQGTGSRIKFYSSVAAVKVRRREFSRKTDLKAADYQYFIPNNPNNPNNPKAQKFSRECYYGEVARQTTRIASMF